jgi:uncharacterized protein YoxC
MRYKISIPNFLSFILIVISANFVPQTANATVSQKNIQFLNQQQLDSLEQISNNTKWIANQAQQKNQILLKENAFYRNQNKKLLEVIDNYDNQYFIFLIIGIVFIALFALLGLFYWREKLRFQNVSEAHQQVTSELESVQSEDKRLLDENAELQETLVSKELELTGLTMQLANLQDSIIRLVNSSTQEHKDATDNGIHALAKDIRAILSHKDYWAEFMIKFTQIHPNFNANIKLKYPVLTAKDISFCSLIKLNLSNKEIANLLQVSHESVITKKYLLKKKLALTPEEDLYQMINTIE